MELDERSGSGQEISLADIVHEVFADTLEEFVGETLVGDWCLVFQSYGQDGRNFSHMLLGPQSTPWSSLGLVSGAEQALKTTAGMLVDPFTFSGIDDDDDEEEDDD